MPEVVSTETCRGVGRADFVTWVRSHFDAEANVRRGICLLNAGRHEQAEASFRRAQQAGSGHRSLHAYLAACAWGRGRAEEAAEEFGEQVDAGTTGVTARIRQAMSLLRVGSAAEAVELLREGVRLTPESAELHSQLGLALASLDQYEEAELRFTQALNIDRNHTDARVNLAMCCGIRAAPAEALSHLLQAQKERPADAGIGVLLAQAARAAQQRGHIVRISADMPNADALIDDRGIAELARIIEAEADFVEAFLTLPEEQVDERVFTLLLRALDQLLVRRSVDPELHHLRGRVLLRLGRCQDAIKENESAVALQPNFVRALIELGKLYQKTDRRREATDRLERAVAAGAEYADVHFLLGNLYRDEGHVGRARSAYRHALELNARYTAASRALEALPTS